MKQYLIFLSIFMLMFGPVFSQDKAGFNVFVVTNLGGGQYQLTGLYTSEGSLADSGVTPGTHFFYDATRFNKYNIISIDAISPFTCTVTPNGHSVAPSAGQGQITDLTINVDFPYETYSTNDITRSANENQFRDKVDSLLTVTSAGQTIGLPAVGHTFSVLDPIVRNTSGDWVDAVVTSDVTTVHQAFVVEALTDSIVIQTSGLFDIAGHGFLVGKTYYLQLVAGTTDTIPATLHFDTRLFHVIDANTLELKTDRSIPVGTGVGPPTGNATIYTQDSTLIGNRFLDHDGNSITWLNGDISTHNYDVFRVNANTELDLNSSGTLKATTTYQKWPHLLSIDTSTNEINRVLATEYFEALGLDTFNNERPVHADATGNLLLAPVASDTSILFVAPNGVDSIARRGDPRYPWSHPFTARDEADSLDLIIVIPGEYTVSGTGEGGDYEVDGTGSNSTIIKDGITYFFYGGAVLRYFGAGSQKLFNNSSGADFDCFVLGNGSFITEGSNQRLADIRNVDLTMTVEADYMSCNHTSSAFLHAGFKNVTYRIREMSLKACVFGGVTTRAMTDTYLNVEIDRFTGSGSTDVKQFQPGPWDNVRMYYTFKEFRETVGHSFYHCDVEWDDVQNSEVIIDFGNAIIDHPTGPQYFRFGIRPDPTNSRFIIKADHMEINAPLIGMFDMVGWDSVSYIGVQGNYKYTKASDALLDMNALGNTKTGYILRVDANIDCPNGGFAVDGPRDADAIMELSGHWQRPTSGALLNFSNVSTPGDPLVIAKDLALTNGGGDAASAVGAVTMNTAGFKYSPNGSLDSDITLVDYFPASGDQLSGIDTYNQYYSVTADTTGQLYRLPTFGDTTVFYVSTAGVDSIARRGDPRFPYRTPWSAAAAASTGNTVIVFSGKYVQDPAGDPGVGEWTGSPNLGGKELNYNFSVGAEVEINSASLIVFEDSAVEGTTVRGKGRFVVKAGAESLMVSAAGSPNGNKCYFEGQSVNFSGSQEIVSVRNDFNHTLILDSLVMGVDRDIIVPDGSDTPVTASFKIDIGVLNFQVSWNRSSTVFGLACGGGDCFYDVHIGRLFLFSNAPASRGAFFDMGGLSAAGDLTSSWHSLSIDYSEIVFFTGNNDFININTYDDQDTDDWDIRINIGECVMLGLAEAYFIGQAPLWGAASLKVHCEDLFINGTGAPIFRDPGPGDVNSRYIFSGKYSTGNNAVFRQSLGRQIEMTGTYTRGGTGPVFEFVDSVVQNADIFLYDLVASGVSGDWASSEDTVTINAAGISWPRTMTEDTLISLVQYRPATGIYASSDTLRNDSTIIEGLSQRSLFFEDLNEISEEAVISRLSANQTYIDMVGASEGAFLVMQDSNRLGFQNINLSRDTLFFSDSNPTDYNLTSAWTVIATDTVTSNIIDCNFATTFVLSHTGNRTSEGRVTVNGFVVDASELFSFNGTEYFEFSGPLQDLSTNDVINVEFRNNLAPGTSDILGSVSPSTLDVWGYIGQPANGIFSDSNDGVTVPGQFNAALTDWIRFDGGYVGLDATPSQITPFIVRKSVNGFMRMEIHNQDAGTGAESAVRSTSNTNTYIETGISSSTRLTSGEAYDLNAAFIHTNGVNGLNIVQDGGSVEDIQFFMGGASNTFRRFIIRDTQVLMRNLTFDTDQTVGASEDGYSMVYRNGTGEIHLESPAYAEFYIDDADPDTISITAATPDTLTDITTGLNSLFVIEGARARYTGEDGVVFTVQYTASLTHSVSNTLLDMYIYKNGSEVVGSFNRRKIGTGGDVGSGGTKCKVQLNAGDYVQPYFDADKSGDITIYGLNFTADRN